MRRTMVGVIVGVGLLSAGASGAAADQSNANNCVGSEVSSSAHAIRQEFDQGFGQFLQSLGLNPGDVIQAFEAANCDG